MPGTTGGVHSEATVGDIVVHDGDGARIGDDGSPRRLPGGVEGFHFFEERGVLHAKCRKVALVPGFGVRVAVDAGLGFRLHPVPQVLRAPAQNRPLHLEGTSRKILAARGNRGRAHLQGHVLRVVEHHQETRRVVAPPVHHVVRMVVAVLVQSAVAEMPRLDGLHGLGKVDLVVPVEVQVVVRTEDRHQGAVDGRVVQQFPQLRHHRQDVVVRRTQLFVERLQAPAHVVVI